MRPRDARALLFWVASTVAVILAVQAGLRNWLLTAIAVAAYNAWLLSRPRMIRMFRRLRGERVERIGSYFID
jgi:hypothetical protein